MMLEYTCKQCNKIFIKRRRGHKFSYCSPNCYKESRKNQKCLEAVKLCQAGLSQTAAAEKAGTTKAAFHCWLHSQGDEYIVKVFEGRVCQHCGESLVGMSCISNRKYCSEYCRAKAQAARKRKMSPVRPSRKFVEFTCQQCGKAASKPNNGNRYKYCSRDCYNESRHNHKCVEAIELCQAGFNKSEAANRAGITRGSLSAWFRKQKTEEISKIYEARKCQCCGKSLLGMPGISNRKYCSATCRNKAKIAKNKYICLHCGEDFVPKHTLSQYQRQHQQPKYCSRDCYNESRKNYKCLEAVKLYQAGMTQKEAAKKAGIKTHILHGWLFNNPESKITTVPKQLYHAKTSNEWIQILRRNTPDGETGAVHLICQTVNGRASGDYFAAFVLDALKRNPCDGDIYAFCSKRNQIISTVHWHNGALCCTKLPKAHGGYIWPASQFGMEIEIQKNEFEYLLQLSKEHGIR